MKSYVKIALFFVFIILIGGIFGVLYLYNKKAADLAKVKPDFTITADNLQKEFDGNEKAATEKYVNKVIEVTGEIAGVKPAGNNVISVQLKTGSDMSSVICTFAAQTNPAVFEAGKTLTVRGVCSGYLMDVLLNNCVVAEGKK